MLAFCDNTGEFLAAKLRRGNADSNTAADHITVCDAALAQIPTPTATAPPSSSGPTPPGPPRSSSPTSARCASRR
jgi:hypothetical protein